MAKLIKLSDTSWKQPFTDRRKETHLWSSHSEVADYCNLENGTKRTIRISFEKKFNIVVEREFQITSSRELYFPMDFQDRIRQIVYDNSDSFFIAEVLDVQPIYSPSDIVWFKSVTNEELGEAYMDKHDTFTLNFPNKHRTNITAPAVNELILIYQKIRGEKCFTHIVTPIDVKEVDENTHPDYRYGRQVRIVAKVSTDQAIPIKTTAWRKITLSGVTQGNACRIANIKNVKDVDSLQLDTWQRFEPFFTAIFKTSKSATAAVLADLSSTEDMASGEEGRMKLIKHMVRERNRKIIDQKKGNAIREEKLFCEVCTFSFPKIYGEQFIECHHRTPISQTTGVVETRLQDLALVCPNCHRMLHRRFNGSYLSIDDLRERMKNLRI